MKVFLETVGCRLNQAEIESIGGEFRAAGHEIVADPRLADLAVVNTCAVTAQAAADSRASVRRIARAGDAKVIATGCWVSLEPESAAALPGVARVIVNSGKDRLAASVLGLSEFDFELETLARQPLPGQRRRTRAFIKVQDGCDNRCTFCVTTIARGKGRSRPIAAVLAEVRAALSGDAQEIVLTGVHLGSWGHDIGLQLRTLVKAILADTQVVRLRLSSLEPWDLDEEFFSLWDDPRLCRHLHLPLQSGCAATLQRMARKATPDSFRRLVCAARRSIPDVAITTDIIAGFPGETDKEFEQSLDFVREMKFAGGHAFSYSVRPGTAASRLPNPVPPEVRRARNATYRSLFEQQSQAYRRGFLGQAVAVLWESTTHVDGRGWCLEGLSDTYIRISSTATTSRWNIVDTVELTALSGKGLSGVIRKTG